MWNSYRPRGAAKGNEPNSGSAVIQPSPKFAVVKDNIDPLRAGRLRVYVEGMSGLDPDDQNSWITVSYMTPFYGQTLPSSPSTGYGTYQTNPHSYGFWASPPDIGTTVVVLFINSDPNFGVWIGCVPEPAHLQMIPAIGSAVPGVKVVPTEAEATSLRGAPRLPATNVNSNNTQFMGGPQFLFESRPVHSYTAAVLHQQGLIRDPIRGAISSSAQRETPSRVTGISTPGRPIYSGGYDDENIADAVTAGTDPQKLKVIGRRGGHSLVLDDGDIIGRDQLVRLRTSAGHQILMSDDGQVLQIIHSNGKSWIELGREGTVDIYATNSVNIRSGAVNIHADADLNLNANGALRMRGKTIHIESTEDTTVRSGGSTTQSTVGNYTVKVGGAMSMASDGVGSYYSSTTMYINGSRINLNTGQSSTVPTEVQPLTEVKHPDTLWDKELGWLPLPGILPSITTRAPTHWPFIGAGNGLPVDVKTTTDEVLPSQPVPGVGQALAAANQTAGSPTTASQSTASTTGVQDPVIAIALSALSAAAKNASSGIGIYGLTPAQLERAGVIKPSTSAQVAANLARGMSLPRALPPSLFTASTDIRTWLNDNAAQTAAATRLLQSAKSDLISLLVITGNESSEVIVPLILSAVAQGAQAVAVTVSNARRQA